MPLITINLNIGHPERNTSGSEATDGAQSKDPYLCRTFVGCIQAFSSGSDLGDVGENSIKQQSCAKPKGILRLRERLRARCAQDDK